MLIPQKYPALRHAATAWPAGSSPQQVPDGAISGGPQPGELWELGLPSGAADWDMADFGCIDADSADGIWRMPALSVQAFRCPGGGWTAVKEAAVNACQDEGLRLPPVLPDGAAALAMLQRSLNAWGRHRALAWLQVDLTPQQWQVFAGGGFDGLVERAVVVSHDGLLPFYARLWDVDDRGLDLFDGQVCLQESTDFGHARGGFQALAAVATDRQDDPGAQLQSLLRCVRLPGVVDWCLAARRRPCTPAESLRHLADRLAGPDAPLLGDVLAEPWPEPGRLLVPVRARWSAPLTAPVSIPVPLRVCVPVPLHQAGDTPPPSQRAATGAPDGPGAMPAKRSRRRRVRRYTEAFHPNGVRAQTSQQAVVAAQVFAVLDELRVARRLGEVIDTDSARMEYFSAERLMPMVRARAGSTATAALVHAALAGVAPSSLVRHVQEAQWLNPRSTDGHIAAVLRQLEEDIPPYWCMGQNQVVALINERDKAHYCCVGTLRLFLLGKKSRPAQDAEKMLDALIASREIYSFYRTQHGPHVDLGALFHHFRTHDIQITFEEVSAMEARIDEACPAQRKLFIVKDVFHAPVNRRNSAERLMQVLQLERGHRPPAWPLYMQAFRQVLCHDSKGAPRYCLGHAATDIYLVLLSLLSGDRDPPATGRGLVHPPDDRDDRDDQPLVKRFAAGPAP